MDGLQMKTIICDDDLSFAKRLADKIDDYFRCNGIVTNTSVIESPSQLLSRKDLFSFDIAFLDVEMKPLTGIQIGEILRAQNRKIIIVYVSAYLEFATQGYKVAALRYVLKRDIARALPECLDAVLNELVPQKDELIYKRDGEIFKIPFHDIYYIEARIRQVNVYGSNAKKCIASFYSRMNELSEQLEPHGFLRINRSYLANVAYILKISSYKVYLKNGVELSATRNDYAILQKKYLNWKASI